MPDLIAFAVDPSLDVDELAKQFLAKGRVHINSFLLPAHAEALLGSIASENQWDLILRVGEWSRTLPHAVRKASGTYFDREVAHIAWVSARNGSSAYLYEERAVGDSLKERKDDASLLARFAEWFDSESIRQ